MRQAVLAISLALVGCGRFGFAPQPDGDADANVPTVDVIPVDGTGLSYPERVLASGPRLYFRLGEPVGSELAIDSSGSGITAGYFETGGTMTLERTGALTADPDTAVRFQGRGNLAPTSDAQLTIQDTDVTWTGDFTIEMFILPHDRPLATDGYNYSLFTCERFEMSGFRAGWRPDDVIRVWTTEGGSDGDLASTAPIRVGEWNHIAIVQDAGNIALYLDGEQIAFGDVNMIPPSSSECGIGAFHGMPTDATFDELAIYERALTVGEIASHFSAR